VPEADIRTQIGVITELNEEFNRKAKELDELRTKYKEERGQSEDQKKRLKQEIAEKEAEISRVRKELTENSARFPSIGASGSLDILAPGATGLTFPGSVYDACIARRCLGCGERLPPSLTIGRQICPKCGVIN
jgi:hypothetical protein